MQQEKIEYLKEIYKEENDRQKIAEVKLSQIISSSGIFLTIIGIIISLLVNSRETLAFWFKAILVIIIISIVLLYILSMISALKGLDPKRFSYQRGNPETVNQFKSESKFFDEVISDYLSCIKANSEINNKKFDFLISARKYFVKGIYLTGFLVIGLILYVAFFLNINNDKTQKVEVISKGQEERLVDIRKSLDSLRSEKRTIGELNNVKK